MAVIDVPLCLKRARREVLMALTADDPISEGVHRRLADRYASEAIHMIEQEPDRRHDWSGLQSEG